MYKKQAKCNHRHMVLCLNTTLLSILKNGLLVDVLLLAWVFNHRVHWACTRADHSSYELKSSSSSYSPILPSPPPSLSMSIPHRTHPHIQSSPSHNTVTFSPTTFHTHIIPVQGKNMSDMPVTTLNASWSQYPQWSLNQEVGVVGYSVEGSITIAF